MKTTINSKAEYLAAVAQWKTEYRELSQDQRSCKLAMRDAQRDRNGDHVSSLYWKVQSNKSLATEMLAQRAQMKIDAQASYLREQALRAA